MKPIIKSPTLRKCIKYWAEYNNVDQVKVYFCSYDRGGVFIADSTLVFACVRTGVSLYVWRDKEVYVKDKKTYTIKELIGEEL